MSGPPDDLPPSGWTWIGVVDLAAAGPTGRRADCEACGHPAVRFVHSLRHHAWPAPLDVGRACAERLTGDSDGPRRAERDLARLARFVRSPLWRAGRGGVEVYCRAGLFLALNPAGSGQYVIHTRWGRVGPFATRPAAKAAAFREFVARRPRRAAGPSRYGRARLAGAGLRARRRPGEGKES